MLQPSSAIPIAGMPDPARGPITPEMLQTLELPQCVDIWEVELPEAVTALVQAAIESGGLLSLNDERGRTILVNAAKISYVEIGQASSRRVGFGS